LKAQEQPIKSTLFCRLCRLDVNRVVSSKGVNDNVGGATSAEVEIVRTVGTKGSQVP